MKKTYPPASVFFRLAVLLCLTVGGAGCGTYSLPRPADTLAAGQFELTGGFDSVWETLGTDANYHQSGGPLAGLTIGRRFDWFEPFLGG